jgi:hypothetical protein
MRRLVLVAVIGSALACASAGGPADTKEKRGASPPRATQSARGQKLVTVDGLRLVHETRRGTLYVRPDHHIGSYDTMFIDPFTLSYRRGQRALSQAATRKLGDQLRADLEDSIRSGGIRIVTEPDLCTLAVQVHIVDLEMFDLDEPSSARSSFIESSGTAMLIFEMRDGVSRQPLVRYGQRRKLPGGTRPGVPGLMSSRGLSAAISALMGEVGAEMATVVPITTKVRAVDCEGRIFQVQGKGLPPARPPEAPAP